MGLIIRLAEGVMHGGQKLTGRKRFHQHASRPKMFSHTGTKAGGQPTGPGGGDKTVANQFPVHLGYDFKAVPAPQLQLSDDQIERTAAIQGNGLFPVVSLIDIVAFAGQQHTQDGSQCDVFVHEEDAPGAGKFEHNLII